MTITKYFRTAGDVRYVAVSTVGERKSILYDRLYDAMDNLSFVYGHDRLMYFM